MNLVKKQIRILQRYISSSLYLNEVEISSCRTIKTTITPLIEALTENKRLLSINLSHNNAGYNLN